MSLPGPRYVVRRAYGGTGLRPRFACERPSKAPLLVVVDLHTGEPVHDAEDPDAARRRAGWLNRSPSGRVVL